MSLFWNIYPFEKKPGAISRNWSEVQKARIRKYVCCWTCHTIPGIHGANGIVGPPLDNIANRAYVAGYPNSPEHLINWIRHPQKVR
ncbi:MAG TPA: hypothetical protein VHM64_17060, partial [Candidatus Binatia bacterium]|nr:hypothetical protein [Candidatus Binatia bacterium]